MTATRYGSLWGLLVLSACNSPASAPPTVQPVAGRVLPSGADTARSDKLPPVPPVTGPVSIRVVYPPAGSTVDDVPTSFIFGSVGSGDAALSINGRPVQVWPNGAWLGWIPFPPDTLMGFELVAVRGADTVRHRHEVRRPRRRVFDTLPWLDTLSITPRGRAWWPADEYLPVSVRASEGSSVSIVLPGGERVPLVSTPARDEVAWGIRAFDRDTANLAAEVRADRYTGVIRGVALGPDPGPIIGRPAGDTVLTTDFPRLEAIRGSDTVRATWPIRLRLLDTLPALVQLDDDTANTGTTDRLTVGRALPGGTYHWFFPNGTRAAVSGRINGDLRLRLSRRNTAWISVADAHLLPPGIPAIHAVAGSATLTPGTPWLTFRLPLNHRIPFQVVEDEHTIRLRLYGASGDVNWIRYGGTDPLVKRIAWDQPAADEVEIEIELSRPVWGFRTRWQRNDLILEIRRPPAIDPSRPLAGTRIVVDPGHPPAGATGPTGLREAEANLAVSLLLREMLAEAGAEVIMTRTTDTPVELWPRVHLADSVSADLLVSIHNNALPDGVNPFTNNGTSVYYNHPRSIPLAMAVQRALVRHLGLRDLGIGRGDLALVRPTAMPSILTEGLFMMLPDQEAALRQPEGQRLYALGVFEGIVEFLRGGGD